jgi:hypothetical protein
VTVSEAAGRWITYRHPEKPTRLTIDVEWDAIYVDDANFQVICQRMGISRRRLIELLETR